MKPETDLAANTYHLRRLFFLRNLFVVVQIVAFVIAAFVAKMHLHAIPLILEIIALALFNVVVWQRLKKPHVVTDNEIFRHLLVDIAALTTVLYFTGGASNPFIILFMFPLVISVTVLPVRFAWVFAVITISSYSFLMFQYIPMNMGMDMAGAGHNMDREFNLHIIGMWMAFVLSAGLVAHFVAKMGGTIRVQEAMLIKARESELRDRQIVELGTLAASTAHEIGTPLGTMNLLVSEMQSELVDAPAQVSQDLALLKSQIDRCKAALSNLSASAGAINVSSGHVKPVSSFLTAVLSEWQIVRADVELSTKWGDSRVGVILDDRTLTQAIMNILDNAADVSPSDVIWEARWDKQELMMDICDRGHGLSKDFKLQLGKSQFNHQEQGLGLGLFLSHAIIERFGGTVSLINREGGGMITRIALPLISEG